MVAVDMTATGSYNPLKTDKTNEMNDNETSFRKQQLERLQKEVVDLEDIKTGISITDLGLNDFRMDLLNYMKEYPNLESAPKGMHAVLPANPEEGLNSGVLYVMRNVHNTININSENRLHPYYMVYINDNGDVTINHTDVKNILDIMRKFCKRYPTPHKPAYEPFNKATDDGKDMQKYSDLLSQSIVSIIDVKEESEVDSLFSGGETTALQNNIKGLDDFELIAFIVIQGE